MINSVNINWVKTKRNVENTITKYIYYNLSVNNSTYLMDKNFYINDVDIVTNENSYFNISEKEIKERVRFINYFKSSFNKLTLCERKIIYWTYIDKENSYDDRYIANNLGFSLGYYYTKKKEAIIRFAYSLGVEVTNDK